LTIPLKIVILFTKGSAYGEIKQIQDLRQRADRDN